MKRLTIALTVLLAVFFQSCQDKVYLENPATRTYQQDAVVLNEFVDINKTTHQFYINPNKRSSVLEYINNNNEDLYSVNSLNASLFKESIEQINAMAGNAASYHSVDYIVMLTSTQGYISMINRKSPIIIKQLSANNQYHKLTEAYIHVNEDTAPYNFYGNSKEMMIELNSQAYKNAGWSFHIICETGSGSSKKIAKILFCGVGHHYNPSFSWQINDTENRNTEWKFTIIKGMGSVNSTIANISFLQ